MSVCVWFRGIRCIIEFDLSSSRGAWGVGVVGWCIEVRGQARSGFAFFCGRDVLWYIRGGPCGWWGRSRGGGECRKGRRRILGSLFTAAVAFGVKRILFVIFFECVLGFVECSARFFALQSGSVGMGHG